MDYNAYNDMYINTGAYHFWCDVAVGLIGRFTCCVCASVCVCACVRVRVCVCVCVCVCCVCVCVYTHSQGKGSVLMLPNFVSD